MIAHVVPILRLRRDTSWWSYAIPRGMRLQAGSLVVVPFRGRQELGIVWGIDGKDDRATEAVSEAFTHRPLVTAPHRAVVEALSEQGICSLSTALYLWLPAGLRGFPLTAEARRLIREFDAAAPHQGSQHAIVVPGMRPRLERQLGTKFGSQFEPLFSETPKQELERWFRIASGDVRVGLGREGSLFAPWPNLQQLTVMEPEDIAYYHEQSPYLSLHTAGKALAEATGATLTQRSRLPQPVAERIWQAQGTEPGAIRVRDLRRIPVINDDLVSDIRIALREGRSVALLLNAHDRMGAPKDGQRPLIPGVETHKRKLAQALGNDYREHAVRLGTRSILADLPENLGLTTVLMADPWLSAGTFADLLHGAADVSYLASLGVPCTVQAYATNDPLMLALANGTFKQELGTRIEEREATGLPPFGTVIACSLPGDNTVEAEALYEKLTPLLAKPWRLSHPFTTPWRKKPFTHLLLQAPAGTRLPFRPRTELASLPRPWRVQRDPWYLA